MNDHLQFYKYKTPFFKAINILVFKMAQQSSPYKICFK